MTLPRLLFKPFNPVAMSPAMQQAWVGYIRKINGCMKSDRMIEMGMKLEEFAEIVFMAGFSAGESMPEH